MINVKGLTSLILNKDLILQGLANSLPSKSGQFVDWTGVIYPEGSFPILPVEPFTDLDPAEFGDGFRAGVNEWMAFGIAAKLASAQSLPATIVELGASQGLWCISWVKYFQRVWPTIPTIALGVEAADAGDETLKFWKANSDLEFLAEIRSNQIILQGSNWKFHWLRRAVSHQIGNHWFPKVDITKDNGRHVSAETDLNLEIFDEVRSITPQEISLKLRKLESYRISLLHLDLQGSELKLLESDQFDSLISIADVIMLGTHSREIELKAHLRLRETHTLLLSEPCEFASQPNYSGLVKDGEQLWINNNVLIIAGDLGLINVSSINMEEILAEYRLKVTESRKAKGVLETIKSGLPKLLIRVHLFGIARTIWRIIHRNN